MRANPSTDPAEALSLDLTTGRAPLGARSSVRSYFPDPTEEVVYLQTDAAQRLSDELAERVILPRAVHICPATDPFPPQSEIQAEVIRVVEVLAKHGIDAWLLTRGYIRPAALRRLAVHRRHVKVTVSLTTLDRNLQRMMEPLAAPPRLRLKQIARLREMGIAVQVALEPLVPGLTDTRASLASLLEALASIGIRHVTAGYLFFRPATREHMERALQPYGLAELVLPAFERGPIIASDFVPPARYLPKNQRQRGYAALMAMAADFGMTVRISYAANPDFRPPCKETPMARSSLPLFRISR